MMWIPQLLSIGAVIARCCALAVGAFYCMWLLYRFMAKPVDLWLVVKVVGLIGSSVGVSIALSSAAWAPWLAASATLVITIGIAFVVGLVGTRDVRHLYSQIRSHEAQT